MSAVIDASTALWRLAPGQALRHRTWDGETLLYNDLSGDTHLLDDTALALLVALRAAPCSEAALAAAAGLDPQQLEALLADLESLALAECIAC